jgi:hypothetical protein
MTDSYTSAPEISEHSRGVALVLAGILGFFGAHRFYVGKTGTGILMVGTLGGLGLWYLYDFILIAAGEFRDAEDRRLVRWFEPNPLSLDASRAAPQLGPVLDELDALRGEMNELGERVDFMERVLAQVKDRPGLPPGSTV